MERGTGFSIVPEMRIRTVVASVELDEFARPVLEAMFDRFSSRRDEIVSQVEDVLGQSTCEFFVGPTQIGSVAHLPKEGWPGFGFELKSSVDISKPRLQQLEIVAVKALAVLLTLLPLERTEEVFIDNERGYFEGAVMQVLVNRYERDSRNRSAAIAIHGWNCNACGFNFESNYGEIGAGFVEVHHKIPLASLGAEYVVSPLEDLVPLCSNCHSMVHRRTPPFSSAELGELIRRMKDDA